MDSNIIKTLVGNNKQDEAFELLIKKCKELSNSNTENDTLLLKSQFHESKQKFNLGLISFPEWMQILTRINLGIVQTCEKLFSTLSLPPTPVFNIKPKKSDTLDEFTIKIQFVAANPTDQSRMQTDREYQIIKSEIERGRSRDLYEFCQPQFSVTSTELLRAMNDKPEIVHFSGHGGENGIIIVTDNNESQQVPDKALKRLFHSLQGITKVVLLNSCYSTKQAKLISEFDIFAIGMNLPIGDEAAISFSKGFYTGLGEGKSFEKAFNDAMIVLLIENPQYAQVVEVWKNGEKLEL